MQLKGLFIGIDRFESPRISWLNCAKRDASALYALFSDTLEGQCTLLTDQQATRIAIEAQIKSLYACHKDDIVVITFSGHGSDTHELIAYDTNLDDLPYSGIPLSALSEWLTNIPSKQLVCILDCCFSGGMGAKAIQAPHKSRSLVSTQILLEQLSGEGRLILTASGAMEPAWETARFGHGLLTYHLLNAMQGAKEVLSNGRISIYKLLEYVTTRVKDDSLSIGKIQHPVLLGHIDGGLEWPVFIRGKSFQMLFPEQCTAKVEPSPQSLLAHGFPQAIIDVWLKHFNAFNQLQLDAINEFGLFQGSNLLISAPTSSGKTMIGELTAISNSLKRKKSIFLFPLKALVNDKLNHFKKSYDEFGLKTIKATGESTSDDILPLMRGQYDICLMTYEKFSALAIANSYILRQISVVVVDEVQMITDKSRGVNLEFLLTLLKVRRQQGIAPQLIALSAVIGDTNGFENWMEAQLLKRTERPVPLDEGIITADGSFRYITSDTKEEKLIPNFIQRLYRKGSSQDLIIPLVAKLVDEGKKVIVFRETRGEASGCAGYLASSLQLPPARETLKSMPQGDPSLSSQKLRKVLEGGVAFHVSDLDVEERLAIEEHFRRPDSSLKVIAATTTLAMGINTPAEAVIVAGLNHPGDVPYSVAEYKNIIGRAGRLGFADRGVSFVVTMSAHEAYHIWQKYILAAPEDIQSLFLSQSTDPKTLIIRVLAANLANTGLSADDICLFLESSFGAFQQKRKLNTWKWSKDLLSRALAELHLHKLVTQTNGLYQLTPLGRLAGEAGLEVTSIVRVVSALQHLKREDIIELNLIALAQLTVELEQVYFPMNKKSTQKEPQKWFSEISRQGVPTAIINMMHGTGLGDSTVGTLRAKKAVASLLWVSQMPINQIEAILTQFGGGFDGAAGAIRSVTARSCDVLPTIGRIAELTFPGISLSTQLSRLLIRLELGIPSQLSTIGFYIGKSFSRGDYLKLHGEGIHTMELLAEADANVLINLLEGNEIKHAIALQAIAKYKDIQQNQIQIPEILPIFET